MILNRPLTHFHSEVDTLVHVLGPHVVRWFGVEDGEDAAVQVALTGSLSVTGHGEDRGAGPVPGDQVGGPAQTQRQLSTSSTCN